MKKLRIALIFLLVPGMIIFIVPVLLGTRVFPADHIIRPLRLLAVLSWVTGGATMRWCARAFFTIGQGSPSPVDPPKVLVTSGLYRFSRNPMYIGFLFILLGHCFFFQSWALPVYLVLIFLLLNLIIIFHEEPALRRQFGEAYEKYSREVPRWIIRR